MKLRKGLNEKIEVSIIFYEKVKDGIKISFADDLLS